MIHHCGDRFGGAPHVIQIGLAIDRAGRAHGDEDILGGELGAGSVHGFGVIRGELQAARADVAAHHFFQARFVDGQDAFVEIGDAFLVDIQAHDPMAQIGQAGAGHQTDVSDANYSNVFHKGFLSSR